MIRDWTPADAQYIRNVFSQPSGRKFLELIRGSIPKVKSKGHEEIVSEALMKQGAEDLFEVMLAQAGDIEPDLREGRDFVDLTREGD